MQSTNKKVGPQLPFLFSYDRLFKGPVQLKDQFKITAGIQHHRMTAGKMIHRKFRNESL